MRSRAGRRWLAVAVGALALVLTGCAGIPTSGAVHAVGDAQNERDEPFTRPLPQAPRPGMTPQQVVAGFLSASSSFDGDHAVARQFLTPDAAQSWNANAGVTVYDASNGTNLKIGEPSKDSKVAVTAPLAGTISAQGEYADAPAGAPMTKSFTLAKVGGQWRISVLLPGLVLDSFSVQSAYRPYDVFFPDPSWQVMVPERILVPAGPGLATSLVRAVLAGPTDWLSPAVRTAVPAGTKLVVDSVPVRDGVAMVDLTAPAAAATDQQAKALSAQLVWTLRQIGEVTSMRLTVEGAPLRVPNVGDVQSRDSWPTFDPDAAPGNADVYFVAKGKLQVLRDNHPQAVPGPAGDGSVVLRRPAVSFDETQVAGLDAAGHQLLGGRIAAGSATDDRVGVLVGGATSLTPPSWDRLGAVWTVDRAPAGDVVWQDKPGSAAVRVTVDGHPAGRIALLRVARDGVRAAVLVRGPSGTQQVYLARIERNGGTLALAGFKPLRVTGVVDVTDLAWSSADRLLLLGRATAAGSVQPSLVDLGGSTVSTVGPFQAGTRIVSVTAAPTNPVIVSATDGLLWWWTGFEWDHLAEGSSPAYPG